MKDYKFEEKLVNPHHILKLILRLLGIVENPWMDFCGNLLM